MRYVRSRDWVRALRRMYLARKGGACVRALALSARRYVRRVFWQWDAEPGSYVSPVLPYLSLPCVTCPLRLFAGVCSVLVRRALPGGHWGVMTSIYSHVGSADVQGVWDLLPARQCE